MNGIKPRESTSLTVDVNGVVAFLVVGGGRGSEVGGRVKVAPSCREENVNGWKSAGFLG